MGQASSYPSLDAIKIVASAYPIVISGERLWGNFGCFLILPQYLKSFFPFNQQHQITTIFCPL